MRSWIIAILGIVIVVGGPCFHVRRIWNMNTECINRGGELVRGAFDFVCVESR